MGGNGQSLKGSGSVPRGRKAKMGDFIEPNKDELTLDKTKIDRANSASIMDMGDIINRMYERGVEEINNLDLTDEEKKEAIQKHFDLANEALDASGKAVNPFVSGRARLSTDQKKGTSADKAAEARGKMDAHINELKEKSAKNKKARENKALTEAAKKADETGALEFEANGKTYYRTRKNSKTWRVR